MTGELLSLVRPDTPWRGAHEDLIAKKTGINSDSARSGPHNLEAEKALLGAILVSNGSLDCVSTFLTPDHFFDPLHGRIFEMLARLIHCGKSASPVTVKPFFENYEPIHADMTVPQYLGHLAANATTIINAAEYGRTVHEFATRRSLIVIGGDMIEAAYAMDVGQPAETQLDEAEKLIAKLRAETDFGRQNAISAASFSGIPPKPRAWHVKGWIPNANVTLLGGDGGTGKSLLALQLAVATATGGTWLGQDVSKGSVLYVGAEDDLDELHRRLADVASDQNIRFENLSKLHLHCLAGEDAVMATFDRSNVMTKTAAWRDVERLAKHVRAKFIVFDTLADLFGGDEINRAQTRQFVQLLRGLALRNGATVLLLAHPSITGMKSGRGTSGSTGWSNSVRSRLYLERVTEDDGKEYDPDARITIILHVMVSSGFSNDAASLIDSVGPSLRRRCPGQTHL